MRAREALAAMRETLRAQRWSRRDEGPAVVRAGAVPARTSVPSLRSPVCGAVLALALSALCSFPEQHAAPEAAHDDNKDANPNDHIERAS